MGDRQPAWLVLDVMADAITDWYWKSDSEEANAMPDEWAKAREASFQGTRDDMATALTALEKRGLISVDWDAEPPEPRIVRLADCLSQYAASEGASDGRD